jgi:hypothetical protein
MSDWNITGAFPGGETSFQSFAGIGISSELNQIARLLHGWSQRHQSSNTPGCVD